MTEIEAIEELKYDCNELGKAIPCDTSWGSSFENAYSMAIQALEKQIAKKPRFYAFNYYCSVCDNLVGNNEFEWRRFKYCDTCGQKLDWSGEQEDEHE